MSFSRYSSPAFLVVVLFSTVNVAFADPVDARQARQEQRIDAGIQSGELTRHEARRLQKQQAHIERMEAKAEADGVVTHRERARIHVAQDAASASIARKKHNRRSR